MSRALDAFNLAIQDSNYLLELNKNDPSSEHSEALKRAALVMALTAWESYIEDRLSEAVTEKVAILKGSFIENYIKQNLTRDINMLHNPNSHKTQELFKTYLDIDIRPAWKFDSYTAQDSAKNLDKLIRKRGEAVHRIKIRNPNQNPPHLVTVDEARKAIRFITSLVKTTDSYLEQQLCPHSELQ